MLEAPEFQQATLQAFIEQADLSNTNVYPLREAFPEETTADLKVVYDVVNQTIGQAASIVGFNAGTPIRSKGQAEQAIAELTKIANAIYLDEVDLYNFENPRTKAEKAQLLNSALITVANLSTAVDDTKELLRAELAYRGRLHYENPVDNISFTLELERPKENNVKPTKTWDDKDSTPIDDIEKAIEQFQKTNGRVKPDYMVFNTRTFNVLRRHPQIKAEIYGSSTDTRIVKDSDFDTLAAELKWPTIVIDDTVTGIEQLDGSTKEVQHLEDGKVVLRAKVLGKTLSGPAKANNYNTGKYTQTVIEQDPDSEKIIVGEVALPILQAVKGTVYLNVLPEDKKAKAAENGKGSTSDTA